MLNPDELNQDPDNDGLTTAQELAIGTNPYHWDTDGDLVPDGWDSYNLDKVGQSSIQQTLSETGRPTQQDCPTLSNIFPRDFQPLKNSEWVAQSQRLLEVAIAYLKEQQSPTADLGTHRLEWDGQQKTLSLTAKDDSQKAWAVSYRSGNWVVDELQATLNSNEIERLTTQLQRQLENRNVRRRELKL